MDVNISARVIIDKARRSAPEEISVGAIAFHTPRARRPNQVSGRCPALADYVAAQGDHLGLFAVSADSDFSGLDEYTATMRQILCHRLAEAATAWLHDRVRGDLWGLPAECGIRPAIGYPSLPDHSLIFTLDKMLRLSEVGISLTENGAMSPDASTCGIIISHPAARYFSVVS